MLSEIRKNLKYLKLKDLMAFPIFLLILIPSQIFRLYLKIIKRPLYLICESKDTARDNGYWLYKYIREKHPADYCFYAIDKKSHDYEKVAKFGKNRVINFGSLKHWFFYLAATYNLSSQKAGNPNAPFFYLLHVKLNLFNNRVFLQHGIIPNDTKWLYYENTRFKKFVCGAKPEYNFIKEKFGYPRGNLIYTGLPRYDNLENPKIDKKSILVMPTWRNWLGRDSNALQKNQDFAETPFAKNWKSFLDDPRLIKFLEENDYTLYFYPHQNMQKYLDFFKSTSKNIKIVSMTEDIQSYLKKCALLITDYSSVFMDFAYMKKPALFFQFDEKEYRQKQYGEGYFSYKKDGFGKVVDTVQSLIKAIKDSAKNNFEITDFYSKRIDNFFERHDNKNCERVYNEVTNKKRPKIMHVVFALDAGGIEILLMNLYRNLPKNQYDFVFLTYKNKAFDFEPEVRSLGGRIIRAEVPKTGNRLSHFFHLYKIIKQERPDLIHCHTYYDSANVVTAAKLLGIKSRIVHSHTTQSFSTIRQRAYGILSLIIRNFSTKRLACSKPAGRALFRNDDFVVFPNGFAIEKYFHNTKTRSKIRKELKISPDQKVIGHVGRMAEVKNHIFLLETFKELVEKDDTYRLILVGDGPLKSQIKQKIAEYKISDKVIMLGSRNDVDELLNAFDLFILPSTYEGLSSALVEAQVNGLVCVASDVVPSEADITNQVIFLSLSSGAKNWANKIHETKLERIPNDRIGAERFSIKNATKLLASIYSEELS